MNNTDALTGKLLKVINQVQGAVSSHGAEATTLVLTSTSIDGICWLSASLLIFLVTLGLAFILIKCKEKYDGSELPIFFLCIFAFLCFLSFIYPWNWIQVFNPKLYLAHEIISKVLD